MANHQAKIDPIYLEVGRRIKAQRERQAPRVTQLTLGDRVNLSRESIANIERGQQQLLLHHAIEIARALGVMLSDLLPSETDPVEGLEDELATKSASEQQFVRAALEKS